MSELDDLYLVLGVKPDAKPEEIQERFRFLANAFHPDKYSSIKQKNLAEEEFKKINNAYQILSNPRKRADYDLQRKTVTNNSWANANEVKRKAEEAARWRAQEEQRRKAEEVARQRAQEKQRKDAEEAARWRAQEEQRNKSKEPTYQRTQGIAQRKIISIHSCNAGAGNSVITANLAAQAALRGYRVAIVDTDIRSPGIHALFGLDEKKMGHTLNEFLRGDCDIKSVAHPVALKGEGGSGVQQLAGKPIWLIPSSINMVDISKVGKQGYDVGLLNKGLSTLIKELKLDYLFIDTHPGMNEETLLFIAISDVLLIIMRPDQQDFQGTAVTVEVARSLEVPNLFIVVNKAHTKYDFNKLRETIRNTYNAPVVGILPWSEDMAELGSADVFSLRFPDHPCSVALRQITDTVLIAV